MAMPNAVKRWTLQELHSLPDDGNKYELVRGELFVTPPPTFDHETIAARLAQVLVPYVAANRLGLVYRPRAVLRFEGSEVEPDLMVRRAAPGADWDHAPIPILVVEVLSPSTRRRDREQKRAFYLDVGVDEYWMVDPEARSITVVIPGRREVVETATLVWSPASTGAPLEIGVAGVFSDA
jgi:Uma2 family endonuclease